jgi:putative transposase
VAISNHRLVNFVDGNVTFRWKDYTHGCKKRLMTLDANEFLRRFLLHALPRGFVRIRSFGFLANRRRTDLLSLCCRLLQSQPPPRRAEESTSAAVSPSLAPLWQCPQCGGPMAVVDRLTARQLHWELTRIAATLDTS